MLSLPGMENYLALTEGQETQAVTLAVDDFLERTRALSEIGWTGYLIGMSDTEKRETFSQPGRTPYQTFLEEPMNRSGLLNQYLSVGSYLVHEYQDAANLDTTDPSKSASDRLRKAQESLRIFEEHSIHPLFGPLVEATADKLWGI